jgi:hypothetical protein
VTILGLVLFGGSMFGLGALVALGLVFGPWWLGGGEES